MKLLLTQEAKWFRVIFFGVLFMLIPTILETSWNSYWKHYYQTEPIETFYRGVSLEVENICFGDITQHFTSVRYVSGTDTGWAADVVRELQKVDKAGNHVKLYDEKASVFIEKKENGRADREGVIPVVPVGQYHWDITLVRLYLPYGVIRESAPVITSNNFSVEECNK